MKFLKYILLTFVLLLPLAAPAAEEGGAAESKTEAAAEAEVAAESKEEPAIDIPEVVMEHLADSYEWHFFNYEGKSYSIPLPVIVRSERTGEWFFQFGAEELPEGFFLNEEAHGKIYEQLPDGTSVRPIDLSLTKSACQIWIVVLLMLWVFLRTAKWYKRHDAKDDAPTGFVGIVEMLTMMIHDDVIKANVGEHAYKRFAKYLLTVFYFIFFTNLVGLIPFSGNVTGNINVTFLLAICTMIAINAFGNKHYWQEVLLPKPLYIWPLLVVVEVIGVITKPFALMVRLFANMMAGHAILLSFTCIILLGATMGVGMATGLGAFSAIMLLFMYTVEVLVAFIQAYVFTLLSSVFIGLAQREGHEE